MALNQISLNPVARPVDVFRQPNVKPPKSRAGILELAQALQQTANTTSKLIPVYEDWGRRDAEEDANRAMVQHSNMLNNKANFLQLVKDGSLPQAGNPYFRVALEQKVAQREAGDQFQGIFQKYQTGQSGVIGADGKPLYVSDDLGAVRNYLHDSIEPLLEGKNVNEVNAMAPLIGDFTDRLVSQHVSRRVHDLEVQGRAEFSANISDLTTAALLGTDREAPAKLQKALADEALVSPGNNRQALGAMLETFQTLGPAVGADGDTLRSLAKSVKTFQNNTLANVPGFDSSVAQYELKYAEQVALHGSRMEREREAGIRSAGLSAFVALRKAFPPGTPVEQMRVQLSKIQEAAPEVYEDLQNRIQESESNYSSLVGIGDKARVKDNLKAIVQKRSNGETWVNLGALMDDTMIRGGGSELRGLMDVGRDVVGSTDPSIWYDIRTTHLQGKLDEKAIARFRPLVGRDKIDKFLDLIDPTSPENKQVDGVSLLSKVATRHELRLTQASDARYVYSDLATPGQTDDKDFVPEERKSEGQKFSLLLSDDLSAYLHAHPKATAEELDEHAAKVTDSIIKNYNLPTQQRVDQLRSERDRQRRDLDTSLASPTKDRALTPAADLEARAVATDRALKFFATKRADVSRVLDAPTTFDGQVPQAYDALKTDLTFGQRVWNVGVASAFTIPEKVTWGDWALSVNQKSNSMRYVPSADPTQGWLEAFNLYGDTSENAAVDHSWQSAMARRDQLRKEIHDGDLEAQAQNVINRVQARARFDGNPGQLSPTLEEKTRLRQIDNNISEYRLLTTLAGVSVDEAKQGGESVYLRLPMFATYGDLKSRGVDVARSLNLNPEQARVFSRTQAALLETRNFVIRNRLGFFGPLQNPAQPLQ